MAMMTKEQLKQQITDTVLPLIKEHAGANVADIVKQVVAAELEKARAAGPAGATAAGMLHAATGAADVAKAVESKALFGAYVRALAGARNDKDKAIKIARSWGYADVATALEKSVEKAMSAGDPLGGGFLVPTEFSQEVIELLRASGVVRSLNPLTMPMPTGSVKVPRITSGSTASYIGENANITKSELKTGQLTLTWKKLAALVPVSNDLIRYSSPSSDTIVRDDMLRALSAREDLAFIRGTGLEGTPMGLKNWIHPDNQFAATGGAVTLANVTTDLGNALKLIMDANITLIVNQGATGGVDVRPGWIFSPRTWKYLTTVQTTIGSYAFRDEMLRGTLWGFPYRVTTQCENTTVYFGAFAHAVIGEAMGITVDASSEAAYHDGTNVVAAFSQDQTVIRVIAEHDFALRHDKAFVLITGVTWGA